MACWSAPRSGRRRRTRRSETQVLCAHRLVEVEADARGVALAGAADDLVALDVVARADAAVAEDAGLVIDGDDRRGDVSLGAVRGELRVLE